LFDSGDLSLIGSIPSELALLTSINYLNIGKRLDRIFLLLLIANISVVISSFYYNTFSILSQNALVSNTGLTGSIPTEITLLTKLRFVGLGK
jgi:hypothetical protein